MEDYITFAISWKIAQMLGLKAAAVMGWIFAYCQSAVLKAEDNSGGRGWVTVSQSELARRLHLEGHTVAGILRSLEGAGLVIVRRCGEKGGRSPRSYTISDEGFRAMGLWPRDWSGRTAAMFGSCVVAGCANLEKSCEAHARLDITFWGINEGVASRYGIRAAVVFQYLWFYLEGHPYTARLKRDGGRAKASYTMRGLARWLAPVISGEREMVHSGGGAYATGIHCVGARARLAGELGEAKGAADLARRALARRARGERGLSAIFRALKLLEREGLIVRVRRGRVTLWAIGDAGYALMGREASSLARSAGYATGHTAQAWVRAAQAKRTSGYAAGVGGAKSAPEGAHGVHTMRGGDCVIASPISLRGEVRLVRKRLGSWLKLTRCSPLRR